MIWPHIQKRCREGNTIITQHKLHYHWEMKNKLRNPSTPKPILITPRQLKGTVPPIDPNPEGEPHPEGAPLQPKYFSGTVEGGTEGNFNGYYFPPVTYRTMAPLTWNKIPKGSPQCQNHTSSVIITIVPQYPTGRQISQNLEFYFPQLGIQCIPKNNITQPLREP